MAASTVTYKSFGRFVKNAHFLLGFSRNSNIHLYRSYSAWKVYGKSGDIYRKFCIHAKSSRLWCCLTGFTTLFGLGLGGLRYSGASLKNDIHETEQNQHGEPIRSQVQRFNFIADVVEKVAPAVVQLEIKGNHPFHGRSMTISNGSGFLVRSDGLIITNAHVVANKHTVMVKLHDGRTFEGVVQVVDPVSDLATVKIEATDLPTIMLGQSSGVRPGEWVVAMGSPLSLNNTVTAGIVSSINRGGQELGIHNRDIEYIQTDAVINFGNSGGPLINLNGEAIGINTMKVTTGISFAIPSDCAREFLTRADDLNKKRDSKGLFKSSPASRQRRYIGLTMLTLTPSIILELKQKVPDFPDLSSGVLVYKIILASPAYMAGLRPGDIVVSINNEEVKSSADVHAAVEAAEKISVVIHRGKEKLTMNIQPELVS